MGYRNYLTIVKKEEFKKVDEKLLDSLKDEDGCLIIPHLFKHLKGVVIYELGKWSDEGAMLERIKTEIPEDLKPACEVIKKYAKEHEYGFNLLSKAELILCINSYKNRVEKYLKDLIAEKSENEFEKRPCEQRIMEYIQEKLRWFPYYVHLEDKTPEQKFKVQDTWQYEYSIFDLVHALKMVDWDENVLVVTGW